MKATLLRLAGVVGICFLGAGCATTYDAQGRPVQSVTPEGAAMAAVAAGIIGYAIGDDDDDHHHKRYKNYKDYKYRGHGSRGYYPTSYRSGRYNRGGYCR